MTITITFQDELAERLRSKAMERNVSVEELATSILDRAVRRVPEAWGEQNQRRFALLRKSTQQALTAEEQQEMDDLQAALDARFEDFDASLKSQLDLMQAEVQ